MRVFPPAVQTQRQAPIVLAGDCLWPSADLRETLLHRDHALVIDPDGTLSAHISLAEARRRFSDSQITIVEGVLAPAFADLHLHWVQNHVRGHFRGNLLDWLRNDIWPAEAALLDAGTAEALAERFWRELIAAGTTTACVYASSFEASVDVCLKRAIGVIACGDAVMTMGVEGALLREPEEALAQVKRLRERWGDGYAITPRFALNVGEELLHLLGHLGQQWGSIIQTHLAETVDEVDAVRRAFPLMSNYTDVYDRCGLLGERTILAHCIHLSDDEWNLVAARRCVVAHCPSSNEALGSGRMDLDACRRRGIDWVLATDIGAGTDLCQFETVRAYLRQHQGICSTTIGEAFARASVCAVPERLQAGRVPAQVLAYNIDAGNHTSESLLERLADRQASDGNLPCMVNFAGTWLTDVV